jgi:hypothetical protein
MAAGSLGTSKMTETFRDPHIGHFNRASKLVIWKALPLVQISVCRSSSPFPRQPRTLLHALPSAPSAPDVDAPFGLIRLADCLHAHACRPYCHLGNTQLDIVTIGRGPILLSFLESDRISNPIWREHYVQKINFGPGCFDSHGRHDPCRGSAYAGAAAAAASGLHLDRLLYRRERGRYVREQQ